MIKLTNSCIDCLYFKVCKFKPVLYEIKHIYEKNVDDLDIQIFCDNYKKDYSMEVQKNDSL